MAVLSKVMATAIDQGQYAAAMLLANELNRARIVPAAQAPEDCLVLGVRGRYLDESTGATRDVILVATRAHPASTAASVLSRVGTALLGLTPGQRIGVPGSRGRPRVLRLLQVDR